MTQSDKPSSDLTPGAVLTLALASIITGFLFGLAAWTMGALARWYRPDLIGLGAGVCVSLLAWLTLLRRWLAILAAEHGVDLSPIGETPPALTRVELATEGDRRLQYADVPLSPEDLRVFASEVIDGSSLTESAWLGTGLFTSRAHFVRFRDSLVKKKWLAWNSPGNTSRGLTLTAAGKAVMRYLAGEWEEHIR